MAISLKAELQEPLRLTLLLRDEANGLLAQPLADGLGIDLGGEAIFVIARGDLVDNLIVILHSIKSNTYLFLGETITPLKRLPSLLIFCTIIQQPFYPRTSRLCPPLDSTISQTDTHTSHYGGHFGNGNKRTLLNR